MSSRGIASSRISSNQCQFMQASETTRHPGASPHQRYKLLRAEVIDAPPFQNHSLRLEHTEDTVALVIVDADEARLRF